MAKRDEVNKKKHSVSTEGDQTSNTSNELPPRRDLPVVEPISDVPLQEVASRPIMKLTEVLDDQNNPSYGNYPATATDNYRIVKTAPSGDRLIIYPDLNNAKGYISPEGEIKVFETPKIVDNINTNTTDTDNYKIVRTSPSGERFVIFPDLNNARGYISPEGDIRVIGIPKMANIIDNVNNILSGVK